jgi:hypothetical protein
MARYRITPNMTPVASPDRRRQGRSRVENARMFALLAMVRTTSILATGEAKMHYNFWRRSLRSANAEETATKRTAPDPAGSR